MKFRATTHEFEGKDTIYYDTDVNGASTALWFFAGANKPIEQFIGHDMDGNEIYDGEKVILKSEIYIAKLIPVLICEDDHADIRLFENGTAKLLAK